MASIDGKRSKLGIVRCATYGTAVACNKLFPCSSFNQVATTDRLEGDTVGINYEMLEDVEVGAEDYRLNWSMNAGYTNVFPYFVAYLMGTSGVPTEVTGAQGDYKHTITLNTNPNANYLTMAAVVSSTETLGWPSVIVNEMTLNYSKVPGYIQADFGAIANIRNLASATNTTAAGVGASSAPTMDQARIELADSFLINAQAGGALSSPTDVVNITSATLTIQRPLRVIHEAKGSSGNSEPGLDNFFKAMLTINLKDMAALTYFTAKNAGTEYKCKLSVDGAQIGSGTNKSIIFYIPRMKIVDDPVYNIGGPFLNPHSITFECLQATANPTGMSSKYPYFEITTTTATSLLA